MTHHDFRKPTDRNSGYEQSILSKICIVVYLEKAKVDVSEIVDEF